MTPESLAVLNQILAEVREGRSEIVSLLREIRDALAPARARLTCEEAGKELRRSRHFLADLCRAKVIPCEITGNAILISREVVDRMVRDGVPRMPARTGRPRKAKAGSLAAEIMALQIKGQ